MSAKKISHIGIAVANLDEAMALYRKLFDVKEFHCEEVPDQKVKIASFPIGETLIELTAPTSEDSPISKFIAARGEGIHHIAAEVEDVNTELQRVRKGGITLINNEATRGAHDMLIAFLHPKSTGGVLFEFCQRDKK